MRTRQCLVANVVLMAMSLQPYPMSPRNSPEGVCHMLETVSCTRILSQASMATLIHQVQDGMQAKGIKLRIDELPGLPEVFPKLDSDAGKVTAQVKPYPASKKPNDMRTPSLYLHSSGSTGYPKSIHFTYSRMLQWMAASKFVRHLFIRHAVIKRLCRRLWQGPRCAVRRDGAAQLPHHRSTHAANISTRYGPGGHCLHPTVARASGCGTPTERIRSRQAREVQCAFCVALLHRGKRRATLGLGTVPYS